MFKDSTNFLIHIKGGVLKNGSSFILKLILNNEEEANDITL